MSRREQTLVNTSRFSTFRRYIFFVLKKNLSYQDMARAKDLCSILQAVCRYCISKCWVRASSDTLFTNELVTAADNSAHPWPNTSTIHDVQPKATIITHCCNIIGTSRSLSELLSNDCLPCCVGCVTCHSTMK